MGTTISFKHNKTDYTLCYTKQTIKALEAQGVNIFELQEMKAPSYTVLDKIYRGAFKENHPRATDEEMDEIFELLKDKEQLWAALVEMIAEHTNALFDEPEDGKNLTWTKNA